MGSGWFSVGAMLGGAGVVLGAFGAHGLKTRVPPDLLANWETAARYHLIHALALLAVGWAVTRWPNRWTGTSGWAFTLGIVLFSGSLYTMTVTGARWLGAVTPFGGLALIVGWVALAIGTGRRER